MKKTKDRLLKIDDLTLLSKYSVYKGKSEYTYNIEYVDDSINNKLIKYVKQYYRFIISKNIGDVVFGEMSTDLTLGLETDTYDYRFNITKYGQIEIVGITAHQSDFIGQDSLKIYNYCDEAYFEDNESYKIYDVEKDIIMTYIDIFSTVCYDKENNFLWGKLLNDGKDIYYVENNDIVDITNERAIKIQTFLDFEENN